MKTLKKLSVILLFGVILATSAGCSEKQISSQELAQKANGFYDILESEDTYASYVKLDEDTAHISDLEKSSILRNAPGMEYLYNPNENYTLINYDYLKFSAHIFHINREQGKNITLDIPEEAIINVSSSAATVNRKKANVSVNGTPIGNYENITKGDLYLRDLLLLNDNDKWSIFIDNTVKTYLVPKIENGAGEDLYILSGKDPS